MRITENERRMFQQWGLGISLSMLLVHNVIHGFDLVSEIVLFFGSIFLLLLFLRRSKKVKAAKFKKGDLVLWNELLGRVEDIYYDEAMDTYFYTLGKYKWVEERDITLADWRDETRIVKRK